MQPQKYNNEDQFKTGKLHIYTFFIINQTGRFVNNLPPYSPTSLRIFDKVSKFRVVRLQAHNKSSSETQDILTQYILIASANKNITANFRIVRSLYAAIQTEIISLSKPNITG